MWDLKILLSMSFSGKSNGKRAANFEQIHLSNMNARGYPEAFTSMSGSKSEQSGVYGGT